jgi:hypothetical protein
MNESRPTKKLPRINSTTYSVTMRREAPLEVTVDAGNVTIVTSDQSMTMSKNTARRLVATLLEKLG